MTARTSLVAMTGLILGGFATMHAAAGDYGISFHYSSYTPSCYSSRYYSSYYPRSHVYYDAYRDYREPVVYVGSTTPSVVVYDDCYPTTYRTTYRTTYTRSDCYTRPVRHARASVHYRSGGHRACKIYRHTYRKTPSYRHHYRTSRHAPRVYTSRHSGSRCRPGDSYSRLRSSFQRYRDGHRGSRLRHHRTPRVRIIRR